MPLNKTLKPVHTAKLKPFNPKTKALKNASVSVNLHSNLEISRFGNLEMEKRFTNPFDLLKKSAIPNHQIKSFPNHQITKLLLWPSTLK
jgi:hypothetical protein